MRLFLYLKEEENTAGQMELCVTCIDRPIPAHTANHRIADGALNSAIDWIRKKGHRQHK